MGAGGYVAADAYRAEATSPLRMRSPVAADADALARGRLLYVQNCFQCHGKAGRGDGPVGRALNPRPADLRLHVTQHTEGQIFDWVSNGVPGSAMPALGSSLSSDDRWRIVAFVKGFAEDGPAPARTAVADYARSSAPAPAAPRRTG